MRFRPRQASPSSPAISRSSAGIASLLALILAGGVAAPAVRSQDSTEDAGRVAMARERLLEVQEKLRVLRSEAQSRRKSQHDRRRELTAERRSVERALSALEEQREKLAKELDDKKQRLDALGAKLDAAREREGALVKRLRSYTRRVSRLVETGIPWNLAGRSSSLEDVETTLSLKDISPAAALAAIGRVQKEEEALARLVEKDVVKVTRGEEEIAVQAFHLGLLGVVFANDTGEVVGFARAGQSLEEGLEALDESAGATDGYLRAVEILSRQRTPSLVEIWFPTLPTSSSKPSARAEKGGER